MSEEDNRQTKNDAVKEDDESPSANGAQLQVKSGGDTEIKSEAPTLEDKPHKDQCHDPEMANNHTPRTNGDIGSNASKLSKKPFLTPLDLKLTELHKPGAIVTNEVVKQPKSSLASSPELLTKQRQSNGWVRHVVAILALSSIVLANMNRQAFNQALISMRKPIVDKSAQENSTQFIDYSTTLGYSTLEHTDYQTPTIITTTETVNNDFSKPAPDGSLEEVDDRFAWTGDQIAILQAAFSYGYTPFMIPGGRMSELYGAKWVVFLSGFGSALCCLLSPFLADTNYYLLVGSRVMMGFCQTGVSPALYALLTRWMPPEESSVYLPMIKVGVMVGFMGGSLISGFFRWRITFYLVGSIGLLWSIMWTFLVTSDPSEHKLVKKNELDYIQREIQRLNKGRKQSANAARKAAAPWYNIITNPVVLGFMFAKFTVKLSTEAQTSQIQMYLKSVFDVSQELNGLLSALNFAIQGIFTGLVAWLAKELIVRKSFGLDKTGVRRLFQGICNFGMGLAYILLSFNMSSLSIVVCAVVLLSVAAMFGAGGEAVTPVDLSTEYSASIMAIANSSANLSGIILPPLVSFIMNDQFGDADRWNIVWWIVGGIMMSGGLVYAFFVTAEIQDFKKESIEKDEGKTEHSTTVIEMEDKTKSERL